MLELLVEMNSPSRVQPDPGSTGILRDFSTHGSMSIPFNHVVLSFWGGKRDLVQARIDTGDIQVGDEVGIIQQITDCNGVPSKDWNGIYAGLGGDYHFLNNGTYSPPDNNDANVPNSRTVIAFNDDYVYFVVVDGWRPDSQGMSILELNSFLTNELLARDAVSMDSGGSSTFVVDGTIRNNTYCNYTRNCGWPPPVIEGTPFPYQMPAQPYTPPVLEACDPGNCKPLVGSSMMLISSLPISQSLTFTPTQAITTTGSVEVRLGPGASYASTGTAPAGAHGEVIPQMNNLNGVLATGSFWWYVDIGDLAGWVQEDKLQGGVEPPPPIVFTNFAFMPSMSRSAAVFTGSRAPLPSEMEPR